MERKISICIGELQSRYGAERALEIAKEIGADAVDFGLEGQSVARENSVYTKSEDEIVTYYTALRRKAEALGIEIGQTHGRMKAYCKDEAENEINRRNARLDCLATAAIGAPATVIHMVTTGEMGPECPVQTMRDLNFRCYNEFAGYAKEFGCKVAFETFGDSPKHGCCDFFGNLSEFLMSYNRVCAAGDNANYMTVCVDTGHVNKATRFNNNPSPADAIRMLGAHTTLLHLNDNDTFTDQHKVPGTGTIDWNDVLTALDEVGYRGNYNMELSLRNIGKNFLVEYAEFAVKVMRYMLKERYGNA